MRSMASAPEHPTRDRTLFQLLAHPAGDRPVLRTAIAVGCLAAAYVAINGVWGLTGSRSTLVSGWLRALVPLEVLLPAVLATLAGGLAWSLARRHASRFVLGTVLLWVLGTWAGRVWQDAVTFPATRFLFESYGDALGALYYRSFFLVPLAVLLFGRWLFPMPEVLLPFRLGRFDATTRLVRRTGPRRLWSTVLVRILLFVTLPVAVLLQAVVGFEPVASGKALVFAPPIVLLALFNAFAEDAILLGFVLPSMVPLVGAGRAIVLAGLFFGLLHWGAAPTVIAGLPQALAIGMLVTVGAKSVVEMRGLGFTVLCHASIDVAIFSSQFI